MELKNKNLFDKFYEEVAREKYPELSKGQLALICYTPFRYLRKAILSGNMPVIHFKYLGKFKPHLFKILKYAKKLDNNHYVSASNDRYINMKKYVVRNYLNKVICEIEKRYLNEDNLQLKTLTYTNYKRLINLFKFKWFYDKDKELNEELNNYEY